MPEAAVALLGLAAGDVLGQPVEGLSQSAAREWDGSAGPAYTDDTQQALVLAYHLLRHGTVVPERLAEDLVALARPGGGVYRGAGLGFRSFLAHLEEGSDVQAAAQPSAGNGAAMRAAPLGIRFADEHPRLIEEAIRAALVTHADPRGVAAGVGAAAAVAAAGRGLAGKDLLYDTAEAAALAEHELFAEHHDRLGPSEHWHTFSNDLTAAIDLVPLAPREVAAAVGKRAARTSAWGIADGTTAYACDSVITALVLGSRSDVGAVTTVTCAVRLGGDADTVGAIAGAVAAARTGHVAWPWEIPNRDLLLAVGRRLASGGDAEGLPDLYEVEEGLG